MKKFLSFILIILVLSISVGCGSYQGIENTVRPSNPSGGGSSSGPETNETYFSVT